MQRVGKAWEDLCSLIIRPQRARYTIGMLGPKFFRLDSSDKIFERNDIQVENPRGYVLECSWYMPAGMPEGTKFPVVIYCHGNCGCRRDAFECVETLLPMGISVFAFDFCGSGLSGGDYVTLGFYERQDMAAVVEYVQSSGRATNVGIWGRSMGAVTSIMYASRDPSIKALVADSPFSSLYQIMLDLVLGYKSWIPKMAVDLTVSQMRRSILSRAEFDIYDLDCTKFASQCDCPALICHGAQDTFVTISHSRAVKEAYRGNVELFELVGDHNSLRPIEFLEEAGRFFRKHLGQPVLVYVASTATRTTLTTRLATLQFHVVTIRDEADIPKAFDRHKRFGAILVDSTTGPDLIKFVRGHSDPNVQSIIVVQALEANPRTAPSKAVPSFDESKGATTEVTENGEDELWDNLYDGEFFVMDPIEEFGKCMEHFYRLW